MLSIIRDVSGNRPSTLCSKILLSIFIEIMTTIANEKDLKDTAILLGIKPEGVPFEKLQVQVRSAVEDSLIRQEIGGELTKFSRATIAYFIIEANTN